MRRVGDISFGTYLYGWPTEQLIRAALEPSASWSTIFLGALPAAFVLGYLSWRMIERPALPYKDVVKRKQTMARQNAQGNLPLL
jgi:peptidoglycan/LPS O-acetylase OafA/YrhL